MHTVSIHLLPELYAWVDTPRYWQSDGQLDGRTHAPLHGQSHVRFPIFIDATCMYSPSDTPMYIYAQIHNLILTFCVDPRSFMHAQNTQKPSHPPLHHIPSLPLSLLLTPQLQQKPRAGPPRSLAERTQLESPQATSPSPASLLLHALPLLPQPGPLRAGLALFHTQSAQLPVPRESLPSYTTFRHDAFCSDLLSIK